MSLNISLMDIPELKELPKTERNEEKGGFFYPEEYIGNVYKFNHKLVYFNDRTMEEISMGMMDTLIKIINNATFDNSEVVERQNNIESAFEQFETDVVQVLEEVKRNVHELKNVEPIDIDFSLIEKQLNDKISEVQKNINSHIAQTREYITLIETKLEDRIESNTLDLIAQIDKVKERDDLNDLISEKVDIKLIDVHKSFKAVTEKLVRDEVSRIENDIKAKAGKLTVSQIAMFKEIGLSVDNIIEMKKNNML